MPLLLHSVPLPMEAPYIVIGQLVSVIYFAIFLLIAPVVGWLENSIMTW